MTTHTAGNSIDLNADVGEGFGAWSMGDDTALLDIVTSANIACGFHAGDASIMRRTCESAAVRGVVIGAHVSYRDLEGFGRRDLAVPADQLADEILYQLGALDLISRATGATLRYVKAHGALYNRCAYDDEHAGALLRALRAHGGTLALLAAPGSVVASLARAEGVRCVTEGFVDRTYRADGTLVPRSDTNALHQTSAACVAQAMSIARDGNVVTADGHTLALTAESLCVHGDTPHAVATARMVRDSLRAAGIALRSFA